LNTLTAALNSGVWRSVVGQTHVQSQEYLDNLIRADYQHDLGRAADPASLSFWIGQLRAGLTDDQLNADLLASDEFFQHAGGNAAAWVDADFQNLLGRSSDPAGTSAWLGELQHGFTRSQVALGIASGPEHEAQRIQRSRRQRRGSLLLDQSTRTRDVQGGPHRQLRLGGEDRVGATLKLTPVAAFLRGGVLGGLRVILQYFG
jgi:hypothetical protein